MVRRNLGFRTLCGIAAACIAGFSASTADAGWHWHASPAGYGSWGSYGGGYGSVGAYSGYGSHGSHGGWRLGGLFHRHHHHHRGGWGSSGGNGSYGSYASWGSNGGSWGGGSSGGGSSGGGSWGGYRSYYGGSSGGGSSGGGSSGGSYGGYYGGGKAMYAPADAAPVEAAPGSTTPMPSVQPPPPPAADAPAPLPAAPGQGNQATLKVTVPEDALVYVNGLLTKSTGTHRSYMSRGLSEGFQYNYEVRAEAIRDGNRVDETKVVRLSAGETLELAFNNLEARTPAETTLTLKVPADAKVSLGGNPVNGEGTVRVFSTTKLAPDKEWSSYAVQVSVERDGQTVTQEKTVSLKAGDSKTLSFDFDATQFAAAR